MKRILHILCLLIPAVSILQAGIHTYTTSSKLSEGNIVKMRIRESGIYRVNYEEIVSAGINPDKVGVIGYGGAMLNQNFTLHRIDDLPVVPVYIEKGSDGVFGSGDYLLFYGQGSVRWTYVNGTFEHTRNPYSDYGYYFLTDAPDSQKDISLMDTPTPLADGNAIDVTTFTDYQLHEEELLNLVDIGRGAEGGGREFYGEKILTGNNLTIRFSYPNIAPQSSMRMRVDWAAAANAVGSTLQLTTGNNTRQITLGNIESGDLYTRAVTSFTRMNDIPASQEPTLRLDYKSNNSNDAVYLNYIEWIAQSQLQLQGGYLAFRQEDNYGDARPNRFRMSQTDESVQIWNITWMDSIHRMPVTRSNDTLIMLGTNKAVEEYIAVKTRNGNYLRPTLLDKVAHQNLHALQDIDFIIVTPDEWQDEALRLGEAHWENDGLRYAVVTDEEVYNEFSSGTPDASAIRWLMKMLYDRAGDDEDNRPKYLLLFGDGTFDNRKLLATSGKATLLTYQARNSTVETQAYTTDDYFAFLEDNDGIVGTSFTDTYGVMRIGVGRLPVNTAEEARQVVDKILSYMENANEGQWQRHLCFLADDGDHNQHTRISDNAAELVRTKNQAFILNKIYLDAYPQVKTASMESYPLAYNRYTNLLKQGVLLMDYSGHGSANNICNEMFLTLSSVQQMTNRNFGFWMLATCSYAHFDKATPSSAEAAVLNPNGGAIGVLSACRTVYASDNEKLNNYFCDTLMGHSDDLTYPMTLGEATRIAKNMTGKKENKLPYILLADPALRLNYPTRHRVLLTQIPDTLRALQEVSLQGIIQTADGDTATSFNGKVYVSVYDKLQEITTRDNDESNNAKKMFYTYKDYSNLLFTGTTNVTEGTFRLTFRMPKDIHYNYDVGRIVFYAIDSLGQNASIGYSHTMTIGGSDPQTQWMTDTVGPELTIYLDHPAFHDGGKTNEYPHFYASIYDENGINTVGSGIGHDLMLTVDNDPNQTYTLNDYFTAANDNYREGQVSYVMTEQTPGAHQLTFRAWDLLNNSASASLHYTVIKGLNPQLYSVTIAPNPCLSSQTAQIIIAADRPDEDLKTHVTIYSLHGEKVFTRDWTEERTLLFTPSAANMKSGIYIIRIQTHTDTSGTSTSVGKLIVL